MLEGLPIICFANDWNSDPTSKTHIMRILSKRNRVLWVNSIGMRRPKASLADFRRALTKLRDGVGGCVRVAPNLLVASPLVLPHPGVAIVDELNARALALWLRRLCRKHSMDRPLVWTFLPNVTRLLGRLSERMTIYHCVDENAAFLDVPRNALLRLERELIQRARIVFASSEQLAVHRRSANPHTYYIPHGVDFNHFAKALDSSSSVPADVGTLRKPVIGFFGLLSDDWIDLPLLYNVARARPDWSIVLIGKATMDLSLVYDCPNIHYLGRRPYAELPAYCRGFDAAIIPFRKSELTMRSNPIKLREYLAAGLPVVSTPLPEVARYGTIVRLADGPDAFVIEIERVLRESCPTGRKRLSEAVRAESWEARVEQISDIVAHVGGLA